LSPPTLVTLHELLQYTTLSDLKVRAKRKFWGEPRLPRFIHLDEGALILEPWDPMIRQQFEITPGRLQRLILPLGHSFSRLWYHEGIWRPVGL
jgi:hypothetical protein